MGKKFQIIMFCFWLCVIFVPAIVYGVRHNTQLHFWKSEIQQKEDWCNINTPMMNISMLDKRVAYCYGEGWSKYCKISYSEHCPDNDYSDYDRCLRNCIVYGQEDVCPC
ncbi:hypothetical protein LCGC14_0694130 [marine sediment metagenome]|uniref:Uncharacterized protein n=1 Tax=marine sediment metagenome TaxID=412755 RepID=A0A0F9T5V1_9ZZZZ